MGCTIAETAHITLGKCTLIIYISNAFSTLVITIYIIIKLHFGFRTPLPYVAPVYISLALKMSREHLWVIDLKTKHHYYPHGMYYCRDCP